MTVVKKKRREKVKIGLGVTAIILAIALIFSVWLYSIERAPKLIKIYMEETDVRWGTNEPYAHVQSVVMNTGSLTAYNCKLHVVLYQGNVVAKEAYILLGENGVISGKNWTIIDEKIYYYGGPLARISVLPEWTTHP